MKNVRQMIRMIRDPKRLSFSRLLKQGKFDQIINHLEQLGKQADPDSQRAWLEAGCNTDDNETPLHAVMKYRPPLKLVKLLISILAEQFPNSVPEDARDAQRRTPLHLAAEHGCHSLIVQRLVDGVAAVMPAVAKDAEDRFPLHWACSKARGGTRIRSMPLRGSGSKNAFQEIENNVRAVFALVVAYPNAAAIQDVHGDTPLELAVRFGADARIIKVLSIAAWRHGAEGCFPKPKELLDSGMEDTQETSTTNEHHVPVDLMLAGLLDANGDMSSIGCSCLSIRETKPHPATEERLIGSLSNEEESETSLLG